MATILVTGGAGYVGSHVARQLAERGERVVTLDNLSTGFRSAVLHGDLVVGDVGDASLVSRLLREHEVEAVMHFAARISVAESMAQPLRYYRDNVSATCTLLACCLEADIRQFVFSSTAAVYGIPPQGLADEASAVAPINPYGRSKLMCEQVLRDLAAATRLRFVALRYFNVAGADPGGRLGECTPGVNHLIKVACEHAVGKRPHVTVFGTDYDTPDGTCVRDYVHVEDVAAAHVAALDHLRRGGASASLNCGYGRGYSVREVLGEVARAAGKDLAIVEGERRAGDPPRLVAATDRIRQELGWTPRYDDLQAIVASALAWERRLLRQPMA